MQGCKPPRFIDWSTYPTLIYHPNIHKGSIFGLIKGNPLVFISHHRGASSTTMVEADAQVVRAGRRFPEVGRWFPKSASVAGRFRKRGETKRDEANGSPKKKDGHIVGGRPDFFMLSFEQMQFFLCFFLCFLLCFLLLGNQCFFSSWRLGDIWFRRFNDANGEFGGVKSKNRSKLSSGRTAFFIGRTVQTVGGFSCGFPRNRSFQK